MIKDYVLSIEDVMMIKEPKIRNLRMPPKLKQFANMKEDGEVAGNNENFFNPDAFFDSIFNSFNNFFKSKDGEESHMKRKRKKQCCSDRCGTAWFMILGILLITAVIVYTFDPYKIVELVEEYSRWFYSYL